MLIGIYGIRVLYYASSPGPRKDREFYNAQTSGCPWGERQHLLSIVAFYGKNRPKGRKTESPTGAPGMGKRKERKGRLKSLGFKNVQI